jgi:hypothetical protein
MTKNVLSQSYCCPNIRLQGCNKFCASSEIALLSVSVFINARATQGQVHKPVEETTNAATSFMQMHNKIYL